MTWIHVFVRSNYLLTFYSQSMKQVVLSFCTLLCIFLQVSISHAAYDVVSCESNSNFFENSCDQCFSGWQVEVWENKGLLSDVWENVGTTDQIMFQEEQEMPYMIALNDATWTEIKASDSVDFWQYTQNFESLYDEENLGYTLSAGESVTWIESSLGSAYQLSSNTSVADSAIGLLAYDLAVHDLDTNGSVELETTKHRECVLFTSASGDTPPVVPETPEELPETGAEHILLAIVALMLGFGFLKFRKIK